MADRSPRLTRLGDDLSAGVPGALERFWREVSAAGTPLIEPVDGGTALVTFLWRGAAASTAVAWGTDLELHRLGGTNLWHGAVALPADLRTVYYLTHDGANAIPTDDTGEGSCHVDPCNRRSVRRRLHEQRAWVMHVVHGPCLIAPHGRRIRGVRAGLVGREPHRTTLETLRAGALRGDGAIVLLVGEAGIGKSALAEAAARRAAGAGMPVLGGRAVADEGAPAFWPWLRALGQAREAGPAGLTPDLLDLHGGAGASRAESAGARFVAIEATIAALRRAAEPAGLLVVLEDLQWADDSSVALLRRLAPDLAGARLLVIGTVRDPDGARSTPPAIRDLVAQPSVRTVPVTTLDVGDVAEYLGPRVHRSWPALVHRLSGGNPLFVRELARLLEGLMDQPASAELRLPGELRRLVVQRLDRLTPRCRVLVGACSVAGEEVDAGVVRALEPEAEVLLAEAVAAGVLVDDPLAPATLRFAHELIRRATYADLSRTERIGWHRRIADVLASGVAGRNRPDELARHRIRAAVDPAERRRASDACADAAAAAANALDFTSARDWYGQALDLLDGDPPRRAELLLARASAEFGDGQFISALGDCARVADLAEELNRADLAAAAAVAVRGFSFSDEGARLCQRARALLGDEESARHAEVLAQHAFLLVQAGSLGEAREISERAMAMAERSGDPAALVGAVHARHQVAGAPEDVAERLALGSRMVSLAGAVGRVDTAMWGHLWRIDAAYQVGTHSAVDADLAALTALADRRGGLLARWHLLRASAARAAIGGDFSRAESLADEARRVAGRLQDPSGEGMYWAFVVSLTPWIGERPGARAAFEPVAANVSTGLPILISTISLFLAQIGEAEQASVWLDRLRPHLADLPRDLLWMPVLVMGGDAAARLGDRSVTEQCYRLLTPHAGYYLNGTTAIYGAVPRALGVMAQALGDLDRAEHHLAEATAMEERIGAVPAQALAQLYHARVLVDRGRRGDRDRALRLAERAANSARRLSMPPIANQASALIDELSGVRGGAATLTAREREIATLVADGLANRAIAEKLVVSERTVESHVRNVLAKLGLSNRTQLATWATRAGLRTESPYQH